MVRYTWFTEQYRRTTSETVEAIEQYARGFLMFLLETTLFSDRGNTVGLYLLSALVHLSQVRHFDWGGTGLTTLYCYMSATFRGRGNIVGGYWRAWELWVCAYFPTLALDPEVEAPLEVPYSRRFEGQCRPRPRETLPYLRQYFDTVRATEITWQPRVVMPGLLSSSLLGHGAPPSTGFCLRDQLAKPSFSRSASCARHRAIPLKRSPHRLHWTCNPQRVSLPRRSATLCWVLTQSFSIRRRSTRHTFTHT